MGLRTQSVSGNSLILAQLIESQSDLIELTIGARLKKIDSEAITKGMEKARSLQLKVLKLTNACLSDESVISLAKFLQTQTLEILHLTNRSEQMNNFND